jgi:hypothetical protein
MSWIVYDLAALLPVLFAVLLLGVIVASVAVLVTARRREREAGVSGTAQSDRGQADLNQ